MNGSGPAAGRGTGELDLREHLDVLRRQRWIVLLTVVVVVGAALALSVRQTPVYESTAEVRVQPLGTADESRVEAELRRRLYGDRELETQRQLVTSRPVAERVVTDLGLDVPPEELVEVVEVRRVAETRILEVSVADTDPALAAALAQGFAEAYLADRRERALDELLVAEADLREQSGRLREEIAELGDQIQQAEQEGSGAQGSGAQGSGAQGSGAQGSGERLAVLRSQRDSLLAQLGQVTGQTARVSSASEFVRGGGTITRAAAVPEEPVSPKPVRNGVLALVLGAMLGVGLGYLRDFLDDAIHGDEDVVRAVDAPVLGHIPRDHDGDGRLVTVVAGRAPAAEAFRTLRSNVRFVFEGGAVAAREDRSLAVTSAGPGEGKTNTACNLAVVCAMAGRRVLLIDADLRRPGVARAFGLDREGGLSQVLVDELDVADAVTDVGVPGLRVLTTGRIPPNPTELLASGRMRELMDAVAGAADLVIYDTAPVLAVADALEVAPHVARTLLVVDVETGERRSLGAAADRLRGVGADVAGCVLNNVPSGGGGYHYGYGYGYEGYEGYGEYRGEGSDGYEGSGRADRGGPVAADGPGPDAGTGRGPGSGDSTARGRVVSLRRATFVQRADAGSG